MDIVFSDDFLKQLEIIETASDNGNIDFKVLYARIGVAIKSLSEISSIDDIPLNWVGDADKKLDIYYSD